MSYDLACGVWDIGGVASQEIARLLLMTKLSLGDDGCGFEDGRRSCWIPIGRCRSTVVEIHIHVVGFWVRKGRFTISDKIIVGETSQYDPLNPEAEDAEDVS